MDSVLGLLGLAVYMAAVIGLASGITFLVVKLSPSKSVKEIEAQNERSAAE
ncbi:MAG TPA: hypothetical protein VM204_02220 [Gaiellaceae bacterium]|nr:hypothetical protein [Gaiellaceae bacterium]